MSVMLGIALALSLHTNLLGPHWIVVRVYLAVLDIVTDTMFIAVILDIPTLTRPTGIWITSVLLSYIINMWAFILGILKHEMQRPAFRMWFNDHGVYCMFVVLLSGLDVQIMSIMSSKLYRSDMTRAPFVAASLRKLEWYSVLGALLENIPQIAAQLCILNISVGFKSDLQVFTLLVSLVDIVFPVIVFSFTSEKGQWWKSYKKSSGFEMTRSGLSQDFLASDEAYDMNCRVMRSSFHLDEYSDSELKYSSEPSATMTEESSLPFG